MDKGKLSKCRECGYVLFDRIGRQSFICQKCNTKQFILCKSKRGGIKL